MNRIIAKSLDRPVDMFGLRGGWIVIFLCLLVGVVCLGFILGSATDFLFGFILVLLGGFISFVFCFIKQRSITSRDLKKYQVISKMEFCVNRRETLNYIMFDNSNNYSWFYLNHKRELEEYQNELARKKEKQLNKN